MCPFQSIPPLVPQETPTASKAAPGATRICLVRHGETDWNAAGRLQGHIDIELNEAGHAQARALARRLAGERFAAIYSSDLTRARQTATAIAAALGQEVRLLADLRERRFGIFEGMTRSEARERHPQEYGAVERRQPDALPPGNGESLAQHARRVSAALQRLALAHAGESLLVVTHGGVLDIVNRWVRSSPLDVPRDFTIPNAAINWISHDAAGWRIECWSDSAHLASDGLDELR